MSRRHRQSGIGISLFAFQDIITCVMGIMLLLTLLLCLQISSVTVREFTPEETVVATEADITALNEQIDELAEKVNAQQALLDSGAIEDLGLLQQQAEQASNDVQRSTADLVQAQQNASQSSARLQQLQQVAEQRKDQVTQAQTLQDDIARIQQQLKRLQSGDRIIYNGHDADSKRCWLVEMNSTNEFLTAELGRSMTPQKFASLIELRKWMTSTNDRSFLLIVKPESADAFDQLTQQLRQQKVTFGFDLLPDSKTAIDPVSGAGA